MLASHTPRRYGTPYLLPPSLRGAPAGLAPKSSILSDSQVLCCGFAAGKSQHSAGLDLLLCLNFRCMFAWSADWPRRASPERGGGSRNAADGGVLGEAAKKNRAR